MTSDTMITGLDFSALELAPAPNITEAIPPSEETLCALIAKDAKNADLHFALGNLHLVAKQTSKAISCYHETLKLTDSAGARCNLGVALLADGEVNEAISELSRAVLRDATMTVAHFHLGRAHLEASSDDAAVASFQKVIATDADNARALGFLARVFDGRGEIDQAREYYSRAFESDPEFIDAEIWLGAEYFTRGKEQLEKSGLLEACANWGRGFALYPRAFSASQAILAEIKRLIVERRSSHALKAAEQAVAASSAETKASSCYLFMLELLFSLGLMPEFYEAAEELESSLARWEAAKEGEGIFPYVHYRTGLLRGYQGEFAEAYEELSFARDHLPSTKQRALKVDAIITAVREISEELLDDSTVTSTTASSDDWSRYGFADMFSREAWKQAGLHPKDAAEWKEAGFSAQQARDWEQQRLAADQAAYWRQSGFADPKIVKVWHRAGFSAEDALRWNELFEDRVSLAIQSRQVGFDDPVEADRWLTVFMFPSEAASWRELGFDASEAKDWLSRGISDPFIARQAADAADGDTDTAEVNDEHAADEGE